MRWPRFKRDWALGLAPQELSGVHEGYLFTALCLFALVLIAIADVKAAPYGTVGAIALIPVVAAAWLLSGRQTLIVVVVASMVAVLTALRGPVPLVTALTDIALVPSLAILARLAATTVVRMRESEISAREASEREARMRDLERAKSEFLRLASHELRGPVSIMRGYLGMLEDQTLGPLPAPVQKVVPIMVASSLGISHTIDQMLDAARLEDSRLQVRPRRVDLSRLVREATQNVQLLRGGSHPVRCEGCAVAVPADLDEARITTVVGNLVSNAMKYSAEGSEVLVRMKVVGDRARIHISDHGVGIAAADMPRLFTRFGRIVNEATRDISGTGLGLYLSRELARLHRGDITAVSVAGEGSTFTLELPLPPTPPAPSAPQPARSARASLPLPPITRRPGRRLAD
ncbi:MAG: HAMP domain-containing sensor histidine kinase [Chloroflexota bacterium]